MTVSILQNGSVNIYGRWNIQIQRVEQIRVRHIECYIEERLEQDIGLRTLQNDMAALRAVLRQAGRRQVVEHPRLTN